MSLDINGIIEATQTILETANTTTASPLDLSSGLTNRVANIVKFSPVYINAQRDKIPAIHVWLESKDIDFKDISINQLNGRREGTLQIKVAGFVAMTNYITQDVNQSEQEVRILMENIEQVLRSNDKLSNTVDRQRITNVTYFDLPYTDEVNFKAAVLSMEAKKYY